MLSRFLDRVVPRTADRIIAISRNVRAFLLEQGISSKKIAMIPLFVAMPSFNRKEDSLLEGISLPEGHKILYTGTLDRFQRLDYLLQAFASVSVPIPSARLILAINHYRIEQVDALKTSAHALGIANRVHFYLDTTIRQLPYFLVHSDVAVIPRPSCPGLPIKMLNYMAAGKAIVAFKGSAMLLQHNESAVLVKDHDVDGLAKGILRCLQDGTFRNRIGCNAKRALEQLRPEYLTRQIESVYKSLIS
jgi:glycosyltransferase involved in cell wall biosynthesis